MRSSHSSMRSAFEHTFQGTVKRSRSHLYLLIGSLCHLQHDSVSMPVLVCEGQENVKDGGCQCRHGFNISVADILRFELRTVNAVGCVFMRH